MMLLTRMNEVKREIQEKARASLDGMRSRKEASEGDQGGRSGKAGRAFCDPKSSRVCLTVCEPRGECEHGCEELRLTLEEALGREGLNIALGKAKTGCHGSCQSGPFIGFPQKGFFYLNVKPEDAQSVVRDTLIEGRIRFDLLSVSPLRSYRTDILYERETGMLAAIDDTVCMVEVAKYFLDFEEGLSCGKCVPCRLGTKRLEECLDRIVLGTGTEQDLEQIRLLCETMAMAAHCQFAMATSRPIMSAITFFRDEFESHVVKKECPARVCEALVKIQRKKAFRERMRRKGGKGRRKKVSRG